MIAATVDAVLHVAMENPNALRLARVEVAGVPYHPVVMPSGEYASMEAITLLAELVDARADGRVRRLRAVIADASVPRPALPGMPANRLAAHGKRLRVEALDCPVGIPVILADDGPQIGVVESVERHPDRLVGVLRLDDSLLAGIAFTAVQAGILRDVSPGLALADRESDAVWGAGTVAWLSLVGTGTACLPSARVLAWWESPDDGRAAQPLNLTGVAMLDPETVPRGLRAMLTSARG